MSDTAERALFARADQKFVNSAQTLYEARADRSVSNMLATASGLDPTLFAHLGPIVDLTILPDMNKELTQVWSHYTGRDDGINGRSLRYLAKLYQPRGIQLKMRITYGSTEEMLYDFYGESSLLVVVESEFVSYGDWKIDLARFSPRLRELTIKTQHGVREDAFSINDITEWVRLRSSTDTHRDHDIRLGIEGTGDVADDKREHLPPMKRLVRLMWEIALSSRNPSLVAHVAFDIEMSVMTAEELRQELIRLAPGYDTRVGAEEVVVTIGAGSYTPRRSLEFFSNRGGCRIRIQTLEPNPLSGLHANPGRAWTEEPRATPGG